MKRKLLTVLIYVFLFVTLAASFSSIVHAVSLDEATEAIDTGKSCSLAIVYRSDEETYDGLTVEIFYVASLGSDLQFSLTNRFAAYPIKVNGIQTQTEWDEVRTTLEMYIAADEIQPDASGITDENGQTLFSALKTGLYYFRHIDPPDRDVPAFSTGLVVIPGLDENGKWMYDLTVFPKPAPKEPSYKTMKIVKEWKDGGENTNKRPASINAEIYRDGVLYEQVTLSSQNNWTYTWETDGEYRWTVIESVVPDGYSVTTTLKDNVFFITNTNEDVPPPPKTGDTTHIYTVIIILDLIGLFLLIFGVLSRRKRLDE